MFLGKAWNTLSGRYETSFLFIDFSENIYTLIDLFCALCSLCSGIHLQVMYGGRVIDSFDRRILTSYMDEYFGDFLFYTYRQFHFFYNKDVDYKIPPQGTKKIYVGPLLLSLT